MASSLAASSAPATVHTRKHGGGLAALGALALALVSVPWVAGEFFAYELGLYLLYGIVAQGIALTWGRAGFLSLGQAVFFGLGAYIAGHVLRSSQNQLALQWLLILAAVVPALL